jgi:hypothetical protein
MPSNFNKTQPGFSESEKVKNHCFRGTLSSFMPMILFHGNKNLKSISAMKNQRNLGSISPMFYAQLLRQQSCASKVQT